MIKLKAEWRQVCPECGVQLVVDFLTDADGCRVCPWCGCAHVCDVHAAREAKRRFIMKSIAKLESRANSQAPPSC